MTFDPFADDVQPEPVVQTETVTENKKENKTVAANNSEGKLTVTLKGGNGFDAPWIVIHADDANDALDQLNDKALGALIARTKEVAGFFSGGTGQAPQRPAQGSAPASKDAPAGDAPQCNHGAMTYRSGVSKKNGQPWKAYFCPAPQGADQCQAKFIK